MGFKAPIKLLFVRGWDQPVEKQFSLLGLGDIVIPAFFIALLLRWDQRRSLAARTNGKCVLRRTRPSANVSHKDKIYFHAVFVAYVAALGTTVFSMLVMNAAQPALLYIVPFIVGASFLTAWARGEIKEWWELDEKSMKSMES